ncbi:hypothetical protein RQP46_005872 [Phenoliferia psychrophenolica]
MLCDHPPACPPSCGHCLAFDRITRSLCSLAPASASSKWCAVHEELQAKLLKSYKRMTLAVDSFDADSLPSSFEAVAEESDVKILRSWSEAARNKWSLTLRVVVARDEHHRQFYQGGDWGHCLFVSTLKDESERLERLMRALDRRAYVLTLAKSQAEWILDTPSIEFICDEPMETPPTPPATPPQGPARDLPLILSKNQRKKAHRKKARQEGSASPPSGDLFPDDDCCPEASSRHLTTSDHLARLRDYLVPPPSLPTSISSSTWTTVISSLFRLVILRTPSLAPLALDPVDDGPHLSSVEEFLDLLEDRMELKCGEEIGALWIGLKFQKSTSEDVKDPGFIGISVLGDAIRDAFRSEVDKEAKHIKILGGRVFKEPTKGEIPGEGWDLFYQFISCSGCSLSITNTFNSWTRNRRLALLGGLPAWLTPGESPTEHAFRLAGMVLCSSNSTNCGKKIKRVEQKETSTRRRGVAKAVVVEEWERAWLFCKMPLDTEWSNAILEALVSSPHFSILARNVATGEHTHYPPTSRCTTLACKCCTGSELWLGRVRSGLNPAERRAASWTTTTFFAVDSVMDSFQTNSSPERRFGFKYEDNRDCLIVDERPYSASGDWESFAQGVADVVIQARGANNLKELLGNERVRAMDEGELQPPSSGEVRLMRRGKAGAEGDLAYSVYAETLKARTMFREQ